MSRIWKSRKWRKLAARLSHTAGEGIDPLRREALRDADAIITCNEVSERHGTGVILNRIFGRSPNILSIRSTHLYEDHSLGAARLAFAHEGLSRAQSFERVLHALHGSTVRRVLCVPYGPDELVTALILKELFAAPMCTYVMDDNNIFHHGIPDELMSEALHKSALRLAISPELRDAYEQKFGLKFWVVPPVVSEQALQTEPQMPGEKNLLARTGVLVGSLWSHVWLQKLRQSIRQAGLQIHWYGNAQASWLKINQKELNADGITDYGFLAESELTARLKEYPYAVVPSGTLDHEDDRPEIARLSLPTRLPYLLAASNTPIIVLGNPSTAAARFLERFRVGFVCPYDGKRLQELAGEVCAAERQLELRRQASTWSRLFSATDLAEWIWRSLELGEPCDDRFEEAFRRNNGEVIAWLDPPVPKDVTGDFALVYHALRRLKGQGFQPDFVLDVGASSGVWSDVAKRIFPEARFILVDPLYSHYARLNDWYFRKHPDFECEPVAVSNLPGEAELSVSPDLYGSSLMHPVDFRSYEPLKVPVRTLDQLARDKKLAGRGLLKIDVQFAEHLVLEGAKDLLGQVDALLLELSLVRYASQAMLFPEMCQLIQRLGFRYYEDAGGWRSPIDGTTLQKDVLFVREDLFPYRAQPAQLAHASGNGNGSTN